jgi:hypothetical protein
VPTYDKTKPDGTVDSPSDPSQITDNYACLEDALNREHIMDGDGSADEGEHRPGECGVLKVDTFAVIDALTDIAGGLAFATDYADFLTNGGSGWTRRGTFPVGTHLLFYQDMVPTGWQIVTTGDDRAVYVTKSKAQGGSRDGGEDFGSWTLSGLTHDHTHTYSQIKSHDHKQKWYNQIISGSANYAYFVGAFTHAAQVGGYKTENAGIASPETDSPSGNDLSSDALWRPKAALVVEGVKA